MQWDVLCVRLRRAKRLDLQGDRDDDTALWDCDTPPLAAWIPPGDASCAGRGSGCAFDRSIKAYGSYVLPNSMAQAEGADPDVIQSQMLRRFEEEFQLLRNPGRRGVS